MYSIFLSLVAQLEILYNENLREFSFSKTEIRPRVLSTGGGGGEGRESFAPQKFFLKKVKS